MYTIKKIYIFILIIFLFIISINNKVHAKYFFESTLDIANLNIDRTKPKLEVIDIKNTNTGYEKYANKTHTITLKVQITEKNIKDISLNKENISIKVGNNIVKIDSVNCKQISHNGEKYVYDVVLTGIKDNGNLEVIFKEGIATDLAGWKNETTNINTNIMIDNIAPSGSISEEKIQNGLVKAKVIANEFIRNLDGWEISQNKKEISKQFTNNISYELPIIDYAGNLGSVKVNVTQATYINLIYASHNSSIGWTFGYGNYDVAGAKSVKDNPIYKTEALAFNVEGNIEKDFVQASSYIYTHWGEGSYAKCNTSNVIYNYGYNPQNGGFKSMASNDLVDINGKKYFQLGGSGINSDMKTDINGNNAISTEVAGQYRYGLCGIKMKLKDYSQYSIIYQILISETGWIRACSDGEECLYNNKKPMSAFRVSLVPKSEKQYVLNTWNKDVGTMKVD